MKFNEEFINELMIFSTRLVIILLHFTYPVWVASEVAGLECICSMIFYTNMFTIYCQTNESWRPAVMEESKLITPRVAATVISRVSTLIGMFSKCTWKCQVSVVKSVWGSVILYLTTHNKYKQSVCVLWQKCLSFWTL